MSEKTGRYVQGRWVEGSAPAPADLEELVDEAARSVRKAIDDVAEAARRALAGRR